MSVEGEIIGSDYTQYGGADTAMSLSWCMCVGLCMCVYCVCGWVPG